MTAPGSRHVPDPGRRPAPLPGGRPGATGRTTAAGHDGGHVTAFVTVVAVALLAVAGLVVDGGNALNARSRAIGTADEAARAGAQGLDLAAYRADGSARLDPRLARGLALDFLADADATGTVTATTAEVTVEVTTTTGTQLLALLGKTEITVRGRATARPSQGAGP